MLLCLLLGILPAERPFVVSKMTAEECVDYGFNSAALQCSTCTEVVSPILGDSEILTRCNACCTTSSSSSSSPSIEKYAKAVLEMDKRSVPYLPNIEKVIAQKKALKLTVKFTYGMPRLLMYKAKDDSEASETIVVNKWDVDTFQDYLREHLI